MDSSAPAATKPPRKHKRRYRFALAFKIGDWDVRVSTMEAKTDKQLLQWIDGEYKRYEGRAALLIEGFMIDPGVLSMHQIHKAQELLGCTT